MLKVNFRRVSGFFASFAARVFMGKKVSFMLKEKNSTLFRQCLCNTMFILCRPADFSYSFRGA